MKQNALELWVGIFVLAGLLTIGVLVVQFGRFGHYFQQSYDLVIEFQDASGIIKDSRVLFRGARVGTVTGSPEIAGGGDIVLLPVRIDSGVRIPREAKFQVGSYGLLGDRFVNIVPPDEASEDYLQPGDRVVGDRSQGIDDLVAEIRPVVARLSSIAERLDNEIFTSAFAENFNETLAGARQTMQRADSLLADAQEGRGLLFTLLKDEQVAADLKATVEEIRMLSHNLRTRGVLFYRDVAGASGTVREEPPQLLEQRRNPR